MNQPHKLVSISKDITKGALYAALLFSTIASQALFFPSHTPEAFAQSAEEIRNKIDQTNETIKKIEAEIASYTIQLNQVSKEKNTLQSTIRQIDLTAKKLAADLKLTENQITSTNLTLNKLSKEIDLKERQIQEGFGIVGATLQTVNERDQVSLLETFLTSNSVSDFWNQAEDIIQFREGVKDRISGLKVLQQDLSNKKQQAEKKKKELTNFKLDLADQKLAVEANKREKSQLLAETQNKESNYQKTLDEKIAAREAFQKELTAFESQLNYIIDPSKLPSVGSGVLKWPLTQVYVTQNFGNTAFAKTLPQFYTGVGHNGIDLRAPIGTPVKAAESGIVVGVGNTDATCPRASYGRWIMIQHDNGLSTMYAHLSVQRVYVNQRVSVGETIGLSGNTGYSTGPHLHFTVFASEGVKIMGLKSKSCSGATYTMPIADLKAYLNPLSYL